MYICLALSVLFANDRIEGNIEAKNMTASHNNNNNNNNSNNNNNNNNNNNRIQRRSSRFFTISSQRRELSPTRTLKWPGRNRAQSRATNRALITCNMSRYVPLGTKGQLSY